MGLALTIVIGTFSTGLLDSALAKRNTAAVAVVQYELDQIDGSPYTTSPQSYSDCFATENATNPLRLSNFQGACSSAYSLRADVTVGPAPGTNAQLWTITVISLPAVGNVGTPVQMIKAIQ
jgi:hypothetical protein